jgi:hypothetical protein
MIARRRLQGRAVHGAQDPRRRIRGKIIRPMLPMLYEFPPEIACDPVQWQNPKTGRW